MLPPELLRRVVEACLAQDAATALPLLRTSRAIADLVMACARRRLLYRNAPTWTQRDWPSAQVRRAVPPIPKAMRKLRPTQWSVLHRATYIPQKRPPWGTSLPCAGVLRNATLRGRLRRVQKALPCRGAHPPHVPSLQVKLIQAMAPPDLELHVNPPACWAYRHKLTPLYDAPPAPLWPLVSRLRLDRLHLKDKDLGAMRLHQWPQLQVRRGAWLVRVGGQRGRTAGDRVEARALFGPKRCIAWGAAGRAFPASRRSTEWVCGCER